MTDKELVAMMKRLGLRQVDVAWMMGSCIRQVSRWMTGHNPVPQSVSLLLQAFEGGKLTPRWFKRRIAIPMPWSDLDYSPSFTSHRLSRRADRPKKS